MLRRQLVDQRARRGAGRRGRREPVCQIALDVDDARRREPPAVEPRDAGKHPWMASVGWTLMLIATEVCADGCGASAGTEAMMLTASAIERCVMGVWSGDGIVGLGRMWGSAR
jgi:hypothetical protein